MKLQFRSTLMLTIYLLVLKVSCGLPNVVPIIQLPGKDEKVCFDRLGCITTTEEWYSIKRPINLQPSGREEIRTTFHLFTKGNGLKGEVLRVGTDGGVPSCCYNSTKETKIIVHGYQVSAKVDWMVDMRKLLLKKLDINVITVDWSKGASTHYPQAVSNIRVVGLEVARMVNALIERKGGSASKFHLIGHSLGAHAVGYAGEMIAGLRRITGLDPAGPLFSTLPTSVRLDSSDAEFVDVIHSDAEDLGLGIADISGHIDFFPNGGHRQPGAEVPGIPHAIIPEEIAKEQDIGSSHGRSVQLFLDSIESLPTLSDDPRRGKQAVKGCRFIGFLCDSYEAFLDGNCASCGEDGTKCALMGINSESYSLREPGSSKPRKFYLKTNSLSPFCGNHYALRLSLAKDSKGRDQVAGELTATVTGDQGVASDMALTDRGVRKMRKGETYTFLGYSPTNAGNVERANVTWKWNPELFTKEYCIIGCVKDVYVSGLEVTNLGYFPSERLQKAAHSGRRDITEIKNEDWTLFNFV